MVCRFVKIAEPPLQPGSVDLEPPLAWPGRRVWRQRQAPSDRESIAAPAPPPIQAGLRRRLLPRAPIEPCSRRCSGWSARRARGLAPGRVTEICTLEARKNCAHQIRKSTPQSAPFRWYPVPPAKTCTQGTCARRIKPHMLSFTRPSHLRRPSGGAQAIDVGTEDEDSVLRVRRRVTNAGKTTAANDSNYGRMAVAA